MPSTHHERTPTAGGWTPKVGSPPGKEITPAKVTQLYPDNVLFWDTSLIQWDNTNDAGNNTMQVSFGAWSAIDYYLLSMPNFPDFR